MKFAILGIKIDYLISDFFSFSQLFHHSQVFWELLYYYYFVTVKKLKTKKINFKNNYSKGRSVVKGPEGTKNANKKVPENLKVCRTFTATLQK
jgi:hypothetical protein